MAAQDLRDYLKEHKIITDGAFGTYFESKYNTDVLPERFNSTDPEKVLAVHREYIQAGSRLIRTNTFASNSSSLGCGRKELADNLRAAVRIAGQAAEGRPDVFIAGDIGPIPGSDEADRQNRTDEYTFIVDTFLTEGIRILIFETFTEVDEILPAIHACRQKWRKENPFILVQVCVNQHGYTNTGLSAARLMAQLSSDRDIDACGFNCGIGPAHMKQMLDRIDMNLDKFVSVLPNASFPRRVANRMVFRGNEEYFALKMKEIAQAGADIIGGCCGTDPHFISRMARSISLENQGHHFKVPAAPTGEKAEVRDRAFWKEPAASTASEGLWQQKLIAVELAPPYLADDRKLMDAANALSGQPVHVITFPDSPSGRTRADSILTALKVSRETGMTVMPHICCRDKNIIAVRSELMGAYLNGLRNFLVITGDPVPTMMRQEAKSVFNFDSVGLMNIIRALNEEQFPNDPIVYGGAINHNRRNTQVEIRRMCRKMDAGARFFLTQPVFSDADVEKLRMFREAMCRHQRETGGSGEEPKLLCGLMPLISRRNALFIQNEMTGIDVTDAVVEKYRDDMSRAEGEAVGVSIVRDVIEKTRDFVDGYYFSIPFNRVYLLKDILK